MRWGRVMIAVVPLTAILLVVSSSPPPSARVSRDFYGVNMGAIPSAHDAARMANGGVTMARYPFDWRAVQPADGPYSWVSTDRVVHRLARRGIETLPILYGTPSWLKHNYRRPPLRPAKARRNWRRFIHASIKRYGTHGTFWTSHPSLPYRPIRYWQVWNEPNLPGFFAPRASPRRYAKLLHISSQAIRGADPHAKVVLAGLPHTALRRGQMVSWRFLTGLYKHGAKGDFDVLAIHPFAITLKGVVAQIKRLRAVARKHGQARIPLWIDEVGWSTGPRPWNPLAVGRQRQASLLRATFRYVQRHRSAFHIKRLFWVLWRDKPHSHGCLFCPAGLIGVHGNAKPSWAAYKRFASR